MAEIVRQSIAGFSTGTEPATVVHPKTIQVMAEVGIDLAGEMTKGVNRFLNDAFDYVITVCDQANETCPVFLGSVRHQMHFGFEDPVQVSGSEEEVIREFRRIRDEIKSKLHHLYQQLIRKEISI